MTYGEMLVVLAVVSILALMFILSSQHAMIKTRYAVVLNDYNTLGQGLDEYVQEHARVPNDQEGLGAIKNPYGSVKKLPDDPFGNVAQTGKNYAYYSNLSSHHQAVVISAGPDGKFDVAEAIENIKQKNQRNPFDKGNASILMSPDDAERFIVQHQYDPTNGSVSPGDVIHTYNFGY